MKTSMVVVFYFKVLLPHHPYRYLVLFFSTRQYFPLGGPIGGSNFLMYATFLTQMGFKWIFVLSLALLQAGYYRRMKWSVLKSRKLVLDVVN